MVAVATAPHLQRDGDGVSDSGLQLLAIEENSRDPLAISSIEERSQEPLGLAPISSGARAAKDSRDMRMLC